MLKLPHLTIWTMVWADDRRWISKAGHVLRYCRTLIEPAHMILFSHGKLAPRDYLWETVSIPQLDWQSYNIFINRVVPAYIKSEFAMSVHEDGFPLDENLWKPEFLNFDYIGAPWSDGVVGNGGFNIESARLMQLKSASPMVADEFRLPSDRLICTARRKYFEDQGIRFAPRELAVEFSTEQVGNNLPSFGFHGRRAAVDKYKAGWQLVNAAMSRMPIQEPINKQGNKFVYVSRIAKAAQAARALQAASGGDSQVALVYVLPADAKYKEWARRFVNSYARFPPDFPHQSIVVLNGCSPSAEHHSMFAPLMGLRFLVHDNSGYDIGAFQRASRENPGLDLMVFFGASAYLRGKGWLLRMVESSRKHGLALYGCHGNMGVISQRVWPHIRTTGWWIKPELLNRYPHLVTKPSQRYEFEHGHNCLAEWIRQRGLKRLIVTWNAEYEHKDWDSFPNGFHRGDQSALLCGDRLTEPPYYHTA